MTREVSNSEDILDSRDIIARIDELEAKESAIKDAREELDTVLGEPSSTQAAIDAAREAATQADDDFDADEREELTTLKALEDEASGYSDWRHGCALIRDSYFQTYAEELASDIGAINANAAWPLSHIDWEAAADELKIDYASVEFGGVTYWVR